MICFVVVNALPNKKINNGSVEVKDYNLGAGFKHFLFSPRKLGKIPILTNIFEMGWFNHQLVMVVYPSLRPCYF